MLCFVLKKTREFLNRRVVVKIWKLRIVISTRISLFEKIKFIRKSRFSGIAFSALDHDHEKQKAKYNLHEQEVTKEGREMGT